MFIYNLKGREDDNIETIKKRFKVYMESSLPVIEYYNAKGKVRKVCFTITLSESITAIFLQQLIFDFLTD